MTDTRNIRLDDELMKNVTGGDGGSAPDPIFHTGDRVRIKKAHEKFDEILIGFKGERPFRD